MADARLTTTDAATTQANVAAALERLDKLTEHGRRVRDRADKIASDRKALAADGVLGEDKGKATELAALQLDAARVIAEAEDTATAIKAAEAMLAIAEKAEADREEAVQRAVNEKLRAEMSSRATALDVSVAALVEEIHGLQELALQVRKPDGGQLYGFIQLRVNMRRALAAAFGRVLDIELIKPVERRTFAQLYGNGTRPAAKPASSGIIAGPEYAADFVPMSQSGTRQ